MRGPILKHERRKAAAQRAEARAKRGDRGQLAKLEREGHGHTKEAKRLRKKLEQGGKS